MHLSKNGKKRVIVLYTAAAAAALISGAAFPQERENQALEEVVVTSAATRLETGFESAKPVTTVTAEQMQVRGVTNVADYLNEMPSFIGTTTPATTTLSSSANGTNVLDLRGLGGTRTLVLVDRRRFVPSKDSGEVNINVIPQVLIERVETVTGGASAQWGSDAVAGVVNMILDRDFEGIKLDTRYGEASEGDAETEFLSFAYGVATQDGRGNIVFGLEYEDYSGVADQSDRSWGRERWGIVGNPLDTGPADGIPARLITPGVVLGLGTDGGYLPLALGNHPSVSQLRFGPGGEVLPYDIGEYPIPNAFAALPFQVGGDGNPFGDPAALSAPYNRKSLMLLSDYELSENLNFFIDASYARSGSQNPTVQPWSLIGGGPDVIMADNPFIPEPLRQVMAENGVPALAMARSNTDHGFITSDTRFETWRIVAGLQGSFGENWNWEIYGATGRTDLDSTQLNNVIKANRAFAIDAVRDPASGEIVCRANVGGANGAPGCVPLNLFGDGSPSQAALDYIHGDTAIEWWVEQDVFSATMSGEAMQLPAGPLSVAFGVEYREESSATTADKISQDAGYFIVNVVPLSGEYDVTEGFLELGAPLWANGDGLYLDVNGAVRYTDYSTVGDVETWQFGVTFQPHEDLRFRGTVSRDIRAPNIAELFSSSRLFFDNVFDPYAGEVRLVPTPIGGNPNLTEEEAETYTVGAVYSPSWLPGLSVSADWYSIEVTDAIIELPAQTIVDNCFENGVLCEFITLQNGQLASVQQNFINVAERKVEGVDIEAVYQFDDIAGGTLNLRWLAAYVGTQSFSPDGVNEFDDAGVVGPDAAGGNATPEWRWNFIGDFTKGNFGAMAQVRYVGGGDYLEGLTAEDINDNSVDDVFYLNLSARYTIPWGEDGNVQLYGGINNVLDEDPPVAPLDFVNNLGTNPELYDVVGQYFYAGLRVRF